VLSPLKVFLFDFAWQIPTKPSTTPTATQGQSNSVMCSWWFCRPSGPQPTISSARGDADTEQLLRSRIPTWEEIRNFTRQPGISIGVIHQGQEVLRHNAGILNIETGQVADSDALYYIASLSKAFMVASLGILVRQGKTSWDSTVHSIRPDFCHAQRPAEFEGMTLRDICSHRTGLLSLDEVTQGLDGRTLIDKKDVVKVCNAMPVKHGLRSRFLYNHGLFELAGHIVGRVSGYASWGDFQHDYIYNPLI